MYRRLVVLLFCAAAFAALVATTATKVDGPRLSARLGGSLIDPQEVSLYHCHDLDYPMIICFTSSAELEEDVRIRELEILSAASASPR